MDVCIDLAVCVFKQKTAYEVRISDWSSDVCSSDLTVDELVQATKDTVVASGLPSCYIRPIAYYGYGEMGLNTLPCSVDSSEERPVGKEGVSTCRSRRSTYH